MGKLTYGEALIKGHTLERLQDWIGISCEPNLANVPWLWDLVCCYPVPKKAGSIVLSPAVTWDVPERTDPIKLSSGEGLLKKGDLGAAF